MTPELNIDGTKIHVKVLKVGEITGVWLDEFVARDRKASPQGNRKERRKARAQNRKKVVHIDFESGSMINLYQKEP